MGQTASLNYRYLRYATVILFAVGTLGAYVLLRRVPVRGPVFWPTLFATALPGAILAGLFIYKSRVGIKKAGLGLSRWALFASLSFLPYHALAWFYVRDRYLVLAGAMIALQSANLVLAAGSSRRQLRFLVMPFAYALAGFVSQIAVMALASGRP
jgi:hypothetical protein